MLLFRDSLHKEDEPMNETYRIFRLYCKLSIEDVASFTKIKKNRLIEIEAGKAEPTDDEVNRLAALYNVMPERMKRSLRDNFSTIIKQPIDATFYETEIEREMIKDSIISLTEYERNIVLLLRTSGNRSEMYNRIVDMFLEDDDIMIRK
jgi:transcriptional regulator with XRE-family HTH domain